MARLVAVGAGRVTGAAAPIKKRVKDRQTVFASATVPQHNHFIRQCVQVQMIIVIYSFFPSGDVWLCVEI